MAFGAPVSVAASAARTTNGNSGAKPAETAGVVNLCVVVTAVSGTTPSLALSVEWSMDGGTTWCPGEPADTFTAITATGNRVKSFTVKAPTFRLVWVITGTTPSFTFQSDAYFTR